MRTEPIYKSTPTFRNYEDYHIAAQYTKGWNDAMDFIFPDAKKIRERERIKKNLRVIEGLEPQAESEE